MPVTSLAEAITRLKALQEEISEQKRGLSGRLTEAEWKEVKRLARAHELPCVLHNTSYGFCLVVYELGVIAGIKPEHLMVIRDHQFPFLSAAGGFAGQGETLRRLHSFTHRRRNQELIAWSGFKPLKPSSHYVY